MQHVSPKCIAHSKLQQMFGSLTFSGDLGPVPMRSFTVMLMMEYPGYPQLQWLSLHKVAQAVHRPKAFAIYDDVVCRLDIKIHLTLHKLHTNCRQLQYIMMWYAGYVSRYICFCTSYTHITGFCNA